MKLILQKTTGQIALVFFLFMSVLNASGQLLYEGMNYTSGSNLQLQGGWTGLNSGDNILIATGNLSYTGLAASVGNKATFDGAGLEALKTFTTQSSGTVYYSFLLDVTALGTLNTTGGYFMGFVDGSSNTNYGAAIWLRSDGAGYDIGLSTRSNSAVTWTSGTTTINTTIFIAVSYQIVSGAGNDVTKLWINPTPGAAEPAATLSTTGGTDMASLGKILLRQESVTTTPSIALDELRVGTTWASVTPAGTAITATGALASLSTTYGTASTTTQFVAAGTGLSEGISINPPTGFEVATTSDFSTAIGTNGSPLVIGGGATVSDTDIFVRLAANASAGNHTGNISLSSSGAQTVTIGTNASNMVNAKELTITGVTAQDKTFDNTTTATLSGTPVLGGVVSGDELLVTIDGTVNPTANFDTAAVGVNKPVTVTGYVLTGSASANYTLTQPTGLTATIFSSGLQDQTITFGPLAPVTYGTTPITLTGTTDAPLTVTYISSNPGIASISGNVVTILGAGTVTITAQQAGDISYNPAVDVPQSLVINQKPLTITGATAQNKTYDSTTTASITGGSLVGVINSDDVSFSGNGNFDTINVGIQGVTGAFVLGGSKAANYVLTQPVLSAEITSKELTITGIAIANKEYDTTTNATITGTASLVGLLPADVTNISLLGSSPVASFNDSAVADNKPVTVSGYVLDGNPFGNYYLTQPTGLTANITLITLEVIELTANDKVYDQTTSVTLSGVAALSGVLPGDEANVSLAGSPTSTFDTATVGTNKPVTVTGYSLSGSSLANYTLTPLTLTASITKKDVTIESASVTDKLYDGTTVATISGTLSGVISPDVVTLNLSATFADANVGTNKPVTSTSTLTDTDAGNYNLVQPTGLTASITAGPCGTASSGNIGWNFGTSTAPSSNTTTGIAVSNIAQGNNNGTTTILITSTPSSGYVGASGTQNAGAAVFTGAFNAATSTYFDFTLTPTPGYDITLTGLSFGSRSTATGPQFYTLRSSADGYVGNIATGTLENTSTWALKTASVTSTSSAAPITFRLYGYGGTGTVGLGTANWKIDDLTLNVSATPVSALSSPLTASTCSGETFSYTPTSVYSGATITWTRAAVAGISNAAVTTPQSSGPSEILLNTTNAPVDVVYEFVITTATCYLIQTVTVTVDNCSSDSIINLKLFIEGYYIGGGAMNTVEDNRSQVPPAEPTTNVETITVELHDATTFGLVAVTTAMLHTDGTAVCTFTTSPSGSFYIAVKSRNAVQTWSANPEAVGASPLTYDFTDAASKAYGDNMVNLGGVFAFYSGDFPSEGIQDDFIDGSDYSIWEGDYNAFAFGDYATDLNGDGFVDGSDYSIWEGNYNNFIFASYPTP